VGSSTFVDSFGRELRLALRRLLGNPRLTLPAVACIAAGVASALFVVALADAILLRAPTLPGHERLTRVWRQTAGDQGDLSLLDARDLASLPAFDAVGIAARTRLAILTANGSERLRGEAVSPGYFDLVGLEPQVGRLFTAAEQAPGGDPVVLIGHDLWQRHFGGDAGAVGSSLRIRGGGAGATETTVTVVGVLPRGFVGTVDPDVSEIWLPLSQSPHRAMFERRDVSNVWVLARRAAGVSLAAAQAEVAALTARLAAAEPASFVDATLVAEPFGESWRRPLRPGMRALLGAGVLLLLIACVNVAHLLLARLARREAELSLRRVLGASGGSLLGGLLLEPLLLALAGGTLGAVTASWAVRRLADHPALSLPSYVSLAPDLRLVGAALLLVLGTALLFGVVPAWLGSRVAAAQQLRGAGRGLTLDTRQRRLGRLLLGSEVAVTFVLVTAGALLLRTWLELARTDVGFRSENLLRMAITLDPAEHPDAAGWIAFADRAREALRRQPGVREVALMSEVLPPWFDETFAVVWAGQSGADQVAPDLREVARHAVDGKLLEVLDVPLAAGRDFTLADRRDDAAAVALVSESLARRLGEGVRERVLGRHLRLVLDPTTGELSPPLEVVGVVADVRYHGPLQAVAGQRIADASPRAPFDLWVPFEQAPSRVISLAIHTSGDPEALIAPLSRELGRLSPSSPLHWISTMEHELRAQIAGASLYGTLTGVYAASAALLAMFGVYGVAANALARRRRELAVRSAVGARRSDLLRLVLGDGLRTVASGIAVGVAAALAVTRLLEGLLHGVQAHDPVVFGAVVAFLLALGLVACWLPARRATRLDPVIVLRED
jgi:putative ABC transport system permease protein